MNHAEKFCQDLGIKIPLICGAMYPCSNPELVAAVSAAGAIGVVQPMSLSFVHGHDFREGLRLIRSQANGPIGLNLILETSSKTYQKRTREWAEVALEEGVEFFVTALGNPAWFVELAHQENRTVFHDVTNERFAKKALDGGVDGFIAVNSSAGGHAGNASAEALFETLAPLGKPIVCAGGLGTPDDFQRILSLGYAGAQLGTRFIATNECSAHEDYKNAIVGATADDIVLTERLTGVPVAIINTPTIQRMGTRAGPVARWLLKGRRTKHWIRTYYSVLSIWKLKNASQSGAAYKDYWQAGKSAGGVKSIKSVKDVVLPFLERWENFRSGTAP